MRGAADHHSDLLFDDPIRVVALVRQRPRIAFHNHRQPHGQRFADTARAGLANEEIGESHVKGDLGSEALQVDRHTMAHRAQLSHGFLVASAKDNHLDFGPAAVDGPGDPHGIQRTLAAE